MKVKFLGGAGTVTGSKTLVESNSGIRILIDCGLFQGLKVLRELNWMPLSISPETIDFVLLTHGHLDHCGWLPVLVNQGFKGQIYCTAPTKEIAKLILIDSAKIQEEEAERINKEKLSLREKAEPLYTEEQAKEVFPLFRVVKTDEETSLDEDISVVFRNAGHIIGACSIELKIEDKTLVFSGDIGQSDDVLMYPPVKPKSADYIFLESTYGNRLHPDTDPKFELETYINNTIHQGGTVIVPSFAVERTQTIMYLIWQLKKEGKLPDVPFVIDTPMGASVLDVFMGNKKWHKLSETDIIEMCKVFSIISDYEDSLEMIGNPLPKVVVAASGMVTGGRVLNYLEHYLSNPEATIIIVGYQAEGTRGRKLLEGATDIKIYGRYYPVLAKILQIDGLSAHGDQNDLLNWLSDLEQKPKKVFLVHGENQPADELRVKIQEKYGFDCVVPLMGQEMEL